MACLDKLIVLATDLLQQVLGCDGFQYILLAGLLEFPAEHQLIQDEVCLLKIEDNVQLAHLKRLPRHQLVGGRIGTSDNYRTQLKIKNLN